MTPVPNVPLAPDVLARMRYYRRTARLLKRLGEHPEVHRSLAAAARIARMERTAFSRFFHREIGITFWEFQRAFRMQVAAELMLERNLSVKEVAYAVGFRCQATFSRNFKRELGVTPSAFRETARDHPSPSSPRQPYIQPELSDHPRSLSADTAARTPEPARPRTSPDPWLP